MFSVQDFIAKYDNYSIEALINIYNNPDGYSEEANEALNIVIARKGGLNKILDSLTEKKIISEEIARIKKEANDFGKKGVDVDFIKKTTTSSILSQEKINEVINQEYTVIEGEIKDQTITSKTIVLAIVGGFIGSIIGGTLWGLQMIYSHRIFYLFFIGLVLICYGAIKITTRQSRKNPAVLVATIVSVSLAILIGQVLYSIVGYIE